MLARLEVESMFNQSGTELTEKISRDSSNLGNLITRHITEFDHTVKNYGGELVGLVSAPRTWPRPCTNTSIPSISV